VPQQVEILSLNIDTTALLTKLSETKKAIDQLQTSQKDLQKAGEGSTTEFVQQAATLKNLQQTYNKQLNVVQQLEKADKNAATAVEAVNTALKSEIKTIDQAVQNNKELRTIRNQVNTSTVEGKAAIDAINKKVDANTEYIRENTSALEKQKMNVGNYTNSIKEALANMNPLNGGIAGFNDRAKEAGGAGNLLKQSFSQLSTGIGGATKSALTFIATPIGAAIAAITAAFLAGKAIFDYNKGLQEANKELRSLGVNAGELSNVRNEVSATAETFDKDFKDIAAKANSLSKSYGISMSEANNIIAEGLAKGGAANEEFLDSLGEYDQLFANAGYSAQEFVDIVNQGYELGIYADKLPDAIKEAGGKG
jgi:chromosome segregation ATPase